MKENTVLVLGYMGFTLGVYAIHQFTVGGNGIVVTGIIQAVTMPLMYILGKRTAKKNSG